VKVLVVDDEKDQVESIQRGLKTKGFGVVAARNAQEALCCLEEEKDEIGLVLADYAMPGMNGLELLKTIRMRYARLPVILMTAYADKEKNVKDLADPRNGFLLKPFTLVELLRKIEALSGYRVFNPYSSLAIYD